MAKTTQKQPKKNNKTMVRPYNIVNSGDNSAEINMYGDVYMETPRDWRTNEPVEGQFISAEDFLNDLDGLKDKDSITVHINSGGGDLYAGLAIYNRLKTLSAEITTVNDGMAASAASLIFQAGDIRQMNAASTFMAHGVSGFLWGSYTVEDLESLVTEFKAHNQAVINVYAERMGVTAEEAADFINGETWLTGSEAVDKGLADEVIGDESEEDAQNGVLTRILNKLEEVSAGWGPEPAVINCVPDTPIPPLRDYKPVDVIARLKKEDEPVIENVKELRDTYPELVREIEDAAKQQERQRIKEIEDIENSVADKKMVKEAKFEAPTSAKDLAFSVMQAQAAVGASMIANLDADTAASGAQAVAAEPSGDEAATDEEKKMMEAKALLEKSDRMRGAK